MEMRLGKNLCIIRRLNLIEPQNERFGQRFLIVGPSSVFDSWINELEKENESDVVCLLGDREYRKRLLNRKHKWNLFNKEGFLCLPEIKDVSWDAVVIDESTFLKNPKSKVARFFMQNFREVPHRYILSGTPNPESMLDLFCQFSFLNNGRPFKTNNFWAFLAKQCRRVGFDYVPNLGVRERVLKAVEKDSFVLHRKDAELDNEKNRVKRSLFLPPELQEVYSGVQSHYILKHNEVLEKTIYAGTAFFWLEAITSGFIKNELVWDGKIKELLYLLEEVLTGQAVVWFTFNQSIHVCKTFLDKKKIKSKIVVGDVPIQERYSIFEEFRNGEFRVLLCQVKCVNFGVDLSPCDTAIYYEQPTGYLDRSQSEDRIVTASNDRSVLIIDLVCKSLVDEQINDLIVNKQVESVRALDLIKEFKNG